MCIFLYPWIVPIPYGTGIDFGYPSLLPREAAAELGQNNWAGQYTELDQNVTFLGQILLVLGLNLSGLGGPWPIFAPTKVRHCREDMCVFLYP
jgi:hypothetical protein